MLKLLKRMALVSAAAMSVALTANAASAGREAKLNIFLSPNHVAVKDGASAFMQTLEEKTGGDMKVRLFAGGSLLGGNATLDGLKTGVADFGLLIMTYFPAELPHAQFINDLGLMAGAYDPMVVTAAVNELVMLNCSRCLEEYSKQGVVFTGNYTTPPFVIISRTAINSPDDLKGKKVRAPGSTYIRWSNHVGAVPINVSGADMYEGLSRGGLDMTLQTVSALQGYSLWDVARHVTLLPLGGYMVAGEFSVAKSFWSSLSEDERRAVLSAADAGLTATVDGYNKEETEVRNLAASKNVEIAEPSEALRRDLAEFTANNNNEILDIARTKYGLENAQELIGRFNELLAKWDGLIDVKTQDAKAISKLMQREIYDKIDVSTYGL